MKPMIKDFPWQFRGKPKIEALCQCWDRQFEQIFSCLEQMKLILDVDRAQGAQLDRIGDIVVLSRADAGLLAAQAGNLDFDVIDDVRYRKYLKYKILENTSNATYKDIISAIKMIWGADKIKYLENEEGPASLTVSFPYHYTAGDVFILPPLTAAGVGIHVRAETELQPNPATLKASAFTQNLVTCTISERMMKAATYPISTKVVPSGTLFTQYHLDTR